MYNKLDSCLSDFSHEREPGDYWYDCAVLEATDILTSFSEDDWVLLLSKLKEKTVFWNIRLVECLGDLHNKYEVDIILSAIDADDEDLFIVGVDSLRLLDLSGLNKYTKDDLSLKASLVLEKTSSPVRKVLEQFINKLR